MAKQRRKIIRAGRLWMAVQYSAIRGPDPLTRREARAQISSPARESLNAKLSWQKLMLSLAANFRRDDLVVTLTYRDADLPARREDADRRLTNFIRALRAVRAAEGQSLTYIRTTEGYHSGGRFHHHLVINSTGEDYEIIRDLWKRNGDNVDFEPFGDDGPERWGKYLTKEPREKGRKHVGDRTWRSSIHMKKPDVKSELVDEGDALLPPAGAFITDKTECQNCYGQFCHMMAVLPEELTE
ncbi:MAG: hypothetical protein IJA75_03150 [Oscillospiraceae bacterium]|nr:hypothetical protein [Oscillospiraceae bacterium]